jgi:hypothetical protein
MGITRVASRLVEFKDQVVYRPNINPKLDRISKAALVGVAALSGLALKHFSKSFVFKVFLTSALLVWLFPLFFDRQVDYQALLQFGITEEDIEKFKSDADQGEFTKFEDFLKGLSSDVVKKLQKAHLFPHLASIIQRGIEQEKISKEVVQKLVPFFREHGIFDGKNFKPNVVITASDGKQFLANKTILLMSSPYFNVLRSGFTEGESQQMTFPKQPSRCVESWLNFFYKGKLPVGLGLEYYFHLYDFSRQALAPDLYGYVIKQLTLGAHKCSEESALTHFLHYFSETEKPSEIPSLEPELATRLISHAMTAFLKYTYGFDRSFRATKELFTIPVQALGLIRANNVLGECLREYVNCVTLTSFLSEETQGNLRLLNKMLDGEVRSKIIGLQISGSSEYSMPTLKSDITYLRQLFPGMDTVCLSLSPCPHLFKLGLTGTLEHLKGQNFSTRILAFGDFETSEGTPWFSFRREGQVFEISVSEIKGILSLATEVTNFSEKTHILIGYPRNGLESLTSVIQSKVNRIVKKINIGPYNDDTNSHKLSFEFEE